MTIGESEGHGSLDGVIKGTELSNISICRFLFPKFPLDENNLIIGMPKEKEEGVIKKCKADLAKITKYLVRQTNTENRYDQSQSWEKLKCLSFWEFLYEVGMFNGNKKLEEFDDQEKATAKNRYLNAISAGIQGSAAVILKREVKDMFVNGYSRQIMRLHKANHDVQICIDQYSVAQYICGYLTKNESGISKLLKT